MALLASLPSTLFNAATLDIVVPASPSLPAAAPPPSFSPSASPSREHCADTDAWVHSLLHAPRPPTLYHDQHLTFYLVVSLPPPPAPLGPLSRAQATFLLLSAPAPVRLQVSADLAYVDTAPAPPPLPQRTSSLLHHTPRNPAQPAAPLPAIVAPSTTTTTQQGIPVATVQVPSGPAGPPPRVWVAQGRTAGEWLGVWELSSDLPFVSTRYRDPRLALTVTVTLRDDPQLGLLLDKVRGNGSEGSGGAVQQAGDLAAGDDDSDEEYMQDTYDDVNLLAALAPISSTRLHLPFSRLATFSPSAAHPAGDNRASKGLHPHDGLGMSDLAAQSYHQQPHHRHPHHHYPTLRRSVRRVLPIRPAIRLALRSFPCAVGALGTSLGADGPTDGGGGSAIGVFGSLRGIGGDERACGDEAGEEGLVLCVEVSGGPGPSTDGVLSAGVRQKESPTQGHDGTRPEENGARPGGTNEYESEDEEAFDIEGIDLLVEGSAGTSPDGRAGCITHHDLQVRVVQSAGVVQEGTVRVCADTATASPAASSGSAASPTPRTQHQHNFLFTVSRIPGDVVSALRPSDANGGGRSGRELPGYPVGAMSGTEPGTSSVPRVVAQSPAQALRGQGGGFTGGPGTFGIGGGGGGMTGAEDDDDFEERDFAGGFDRTLSGGGDGASGAVRSAFERKVTFVVRGRPVRLRPRRDRHRELSRSNESTDPPRGYDVPDAAGEAKGQDGGPAEPARAPAGGKADSTSDEEEEAEAVTLPFACKWHCTLDISALDSRPTSRPRRTAFAPDFSAMPSAGPRPTYIGPQSGPPYLSAIQAVQNAATRFPLRSAPASAAAAAAAANQANVESVAGSKRHTKASLAALSLRSPVLGRKGRGDSFAAFPTQPPPVQNDVRRPLSAASSVRALPPTPLSPPAVAPTLAGPVSASSAPTKRFFSLPSSSAAPGAGNSDTAAALPVHVVTPLRTETPPPMNGHPVPTVPAAAASTKRMSVPHPGAGASSSGAAPASSSAARLEATRPKEARRTSWMSGLVSGGGGGGTPSTATTVAAENGDRTSWPAPSAGSTALGLGLEDPAAPASQERGQREVQQLSSSYPAPSTVPVHSQVHHTSGKLLISVSLVPLRAAKSRRGPFVGGAGNGAPSAGQSSESDRLAYDGAANLPPPVLPGLALSRAASPDPLAAAKTSTSATAAAPRFAFPATPSSSSSSSPGASPLPSPPLLARPSPRPPPTEAQEGSSPAAAEDLRVLAERSSRATSRMPRVNLLDVFLVEVFVFNQSDQIKRFTVGVVPRKQPSAPAGSVGTASARNGEGPRKSLGEEENEKLARLVPLENDVRIEPLAPNSCASVGIRFLAIRPGAHAVDALRLVDLADGTETRLERPLWVVVE